MELVHHKPDKRTVCWAMFVEDPSQSFMPFGAQKNTLKGEPDASPSWRTVHLSEPFSHDQNASRGSRCMPACWTRSLILVGVQMTHLQELLLRCMKKELKWAPCCMLFYLCRYRGLIMQRPITYYKSIQAVCISRRISGWGICSG